MMEVVDFLVMEAPIHMVTAITMVVVLTEGDMAEMLAAAMAEEDIDFIQPTALHWRLPSMKTCSYCGKQYPDNAEVCDLDQHPLKLAVDSASLKEDKVEYTNADIIEIAKKQQMLLWAFFFSLIILRIQNTKILAVLIFAIFIYLLAKALRSPFSWLYAILAIIPLVGFITLAVINSKATEALKKRGIRVGLMGAKKEDLTKFYGPNPTP